MQGGGSGQFSAVPLNLCTNMGKSNLISYPTDNFIKKYTEFAENDFLFS